jgi:hypothetical protein
MGRMLLASTTIDAPPARVWGPRARAMGASLDSRGSKLPHRVDVPNWANTYAREPERLNDEMRALAGAYPGAARVEVAGRSLDGRDIVALVVGAHADDPSVPRILVTGGVHARETANGPLLVEWARDLLGRSALGDAARGALLANRTVVIVPQVSPDTAATVADGLKTGDEPRIWARTNHAGVDLNRNFPGPTWGAGSSDPTNQNYHGPAPASEPETRAVMALGAAWTPSAVYDIHSPGGVILVPSSRTGTPAADSRAAAALANRASGYEATTSSDQWAHETGGTVKDWAHDVLGVPGLTIETGAVTHQNEILAADTRSRLFPTLDALVATIDGRHLAPDGAELLATPPRADRFVLAEHLQGVEVRWPARH